MSFFVCVLFFVSVFRIMCTIFYFERMLFCEHYFSIVQPLLVL